MTLIQNSARECKLMFGNKRDDKNDYQKGHSLPKFVDDNYYESHYNNDMTCE